MADFTDTFNRANASDLKNNWKYRYRHEASGVAVPWRVVSNVARPPTDTGLNVLAYRSGLQAPNNTFSCQWVIKNPIGSNNAEMFFRYNANTGAGNSRFSIVIIDGNGYLRKRSWTQAAGAESSVDVATWVRTPNNEYTITVDVTDEDLITIYDSGFTGTDFKAAELTDSYNAVNTGVGMTSGWFDQIVFDDIGQGTSADFDVSEITASLLCDLRLDGANPPGGAFPDAVQLMTGFEVHDYTVVEGIPQAVAGIKRDSAAISTTSIVKVDTGTAISPHDVVPTSDYRWLPDTGFAAGSWTPVGGGLIIGMSSVDDPAIATAYRYPAIGGTLQRAAICFKGAAYGRLGGFAGAPANTDFTIAITAVLKSAPSGKDYGVFMSDTTDEGDASLGTPLGVLYRTGQLQLNAGKRILARESWKSVGKPTTIILSVGTDTGDVSKRFNGGRLLIQDAKRTIQNFSTTGMDRSGRLFFAAHMSVIDEFSANTAGELDVLEIDYWTRALHPGEMLEHNNLMSAVYGVST